MNNTLNPKSTVLKQLLSVFTVIKVGFGYTLLYASPTFTQNACNRTSQPAWESSLAQ
jgi:capsid portal protein